MGIQENLQRGQTVAVTIAADDVGIGGSGGLTDDELRASDVPVTLDGETVTVDLGANNDVTVTNATAANLKVDGSDVTQPISASSLPLPTGAATAANQSTIIGHVDGVEGLLTTIDSVLDTIKVDTEAIETAVEGTLTVDATGQGDVPITLDSEAVVLGAGTAGIGKLTANSGVDIGDVDVTSISAGTNTIGGTFPVASTSGTGTSTYYDADLDETKIEVTDNATVMIYSIAAFNTTAAPLFLQLFDADADNVTVGSTTPTNQYVIPGNADSDGAGFTLTFAVPKAYTTGFTVACTTDSEGSSAPGTGACLVNIEYID